MDRVQTKVRNPHATQIITVITLCPPSALQITLTGGSNPTPNQSDPLPPTGTPSASPSLVLFVALCAACVAITLAAVLLHVRVITEVTTDLKASLNSPKAV